MQSALMDPNSIENNRFHGAEFRIRDCNRNLIDVGAADVTFLVSVSDSVLLRNEKKTKHGTLELEFDS